MHIFWQAHRGGGGGGQSYIDQKDDETHLPQASGTGGGASRCRGRWWGRCRRASPDVQMTGGFEPSTLAMLAYGADNWTVHASYSLICASWAWARV